MLAAQPLLAGSGAPWRRAPAAPRSHATAVARVQSRCGPSPRREKSLVADSLRTGFRRASRPRDTAARASAAEGPGGTAEGNWGDTNWLQTSLNVAIVEEDFALAAKCVGLSKSTLASAEGASCSLATAAVAWAAGVSTHQERDFVTRVPNHLVPANPHQPRPLAAPRLSQSPLRSSHSAANPPLLRPCASRRLKKRLAELAGDYKGPTDWFNLGLPMWLVDRAERLGYRVPTEARRAAVIARAASPPWPGRNKQR